MVRALEAIGAAVESGRSGRGLLRRRRAAWNLRRRLARGSGGRARGRSGGRGRGSASAPTRFAPSLAAGGMAGGRFRPLRVAGLAPRRPGRARRGVDRGARTARDRTLGALARLTPDQVADRFGPLGLRALRLARGEEEPLRPRTPARGSDRGDRAAGRDRRAASSTAPWSCSSTACSRRRSGSGRTLLGLRLGARLAGGGSWSVEQGLGRPSASARVLRSVLAPRLEELPGPATALRLRAVGLGPPASDQLEFAVGGDRAAPAPARRRGARGPRRPGRRGAAEDPPGRRRLAGARALGDADPLPGAVTPRPLAPPLRPPARRGRGRPRGAPARSTASASTRSARSGWSRTAGGRREPLRRHYFELALADGRALAVFRAR